MTFGCVFNGHAFGIDARMELGCWLQGFDLGSGLKSMLVSVKSVAPNLQAAVVIAVDVDSVPVLGGGRMATGRACSRFIRREPTCSVPGGVHHLSSSILCSIV